MTICQNHCKVLLPWNYCEIVAFAMRIVNSGNLKHALHQKKKKTNEKCANMTNQRHMFDILSSTFDFHSHFCFRLWLFFFFLHENCAQKLTLNWTDTQTRIHINITFYEWKSFHLFIGFHNVDTGCEDSKVEKYLIAIDITIVASNTNKKKEKQQSEMANSAFWHKKR